VQTQHPQPSATTACTACDCAAHRAKADPTVDRPVSAWSALLPVLACALCPACVSMYSSLLATVGLGLVMTETQHHALLAVAVLAALGFSAWRASRTGSWRFVLVTAAGCALLVAAHLFGEIAILTWTGIATLLLGGWLERRSRRARARGSDTVAPVAVSDECGTTSR